MTQPAKSVLIIGATGRVGSQVRATLLNQTEARLTLFSRHAACLELDSDREKAFSGSVDDPQELDAVVEGQDCVFVAVSGDLASMAGRIVESMKRKGVSRMIFVSSMGIYNEIPASIGAEGNLRFNPVLRDYREAADAVEESGLDYTIIRPGWFVSGPVNYQVTLKGEPFGGHDVSVASIADLVRRIVEDPDLYSEQSVGINRPQ